MDYLTHLVWTFLTSLRKPESGHIPDLSPWDFFLSKNVAIVLALGAPVTFCRQSHSNRLIFACGSEIKPSPHFLGIAKPAFPVFLRTVESLHSKVTCKRNKQLASYSFLLFYGTSSQNLLWGDERGGRAFVSAQVWEEKFMPPLGVTGESEAPRKDVLWARPRG